MTHTNAMPARAARILVIDDSATVRLSLRDTLVAHGYEVLDAVSGGEALGLLRSETIDVVLLDLIMPEMSGRDVLREMKMDDELTCIPVLMLTAVADRKELTECLDMGADDFVVKPWYDRELLARLRTMVSLRRSIRSARESSRRTQALLDSTPHVSILLDREGTILACNEPGARLLGTTVEQLEGRTLFDPRLAPQLEEWRDRVETVLCNGSRLDYEEEWGDRLLQTSVHPVQDTHGQIVGTAITTLDVTNQRRLEHQLLHAQKMESIGQLAAGLSHEINTPAQYVGDNTRFLDTSFHELFPSLAKAGELTKAVCNGAEYRELAAELRSDLDQLDIEDLVEEIPRAIKQSLEGIERVRKIVQSMKEFSHPGAGGMTRIDINHAIESTITVSSGEWKYVAEVETELDTELPLVPCLPNELNQVILNILVNAAHAIEDVVGDEPERKGCITVSTGCVDGFAEIRIADTGTGIPEAIKDRVFNPFFTTKDVGRGTGQGLAMAYAVVVNKHGGTLAFETENGKGTTFIIRLPLAQQLELGAVG